jgi:cold shock CspA family protein
LYLLLAEFENYPLIPVESNSAHQNAAVLESYLDSHGFLRYAAENWIGHFRKIGAAEIQLCRLVLKVLDTQSRRFSTWFWVYWTGKLGFKFPPQGLSDLHIASYLGLKLVVQQLLKKGVDINASGPDGQTPVDFAIEGSQAGIATTLCLRGAQHTSRRFRPKQIGIVKWFNIHKGYGFIFPKDDSKDVFFALDLEYDDELKMVCEGARVLFTTVLSPNGRIWGIPIKFEVE